MITKTHIYLLKKLHFKILKNIYISDQGCWVWCGVMNRNGYGRFFHNGKYRMAHRFIYELLHGKIKDGKLLDHIYSAKYCSRACCNPTHVSPVTPKQNTHRGKAILFKGTINDY